MTTKRQRKFTILIIALVLGLGVFLTWYKTSLPRRFAPLEPNVLYRSGQGKFNQFQNAIDRYHIKTIICLRETKKEKNIDWYEAEKKIAEKNNVNFIHWPMDSRKPLAIEYQINFLKMTQDPEKTPILIHCAQGRHRTGFFAGLYRLVIDGWTIDQTLDELYQFNFGHNHPQLIDALRRIDPESFRRRMKDEEVPEP